MTISAVGARTRCLSCDGERLTTILSLGELPLANAYLEAMDSCEEARFPLDLAFCRTCALVQLRHVVPPDRLFSEYLYFSSYSASMLRHAEALAARLVGERRLGAGSLVVEIASNDGYLLQFFLKAGVTVLGIEPAVNVGRVAREERNIPTVSAFFGPELAADLAKGGQYADVVLGLNVLAHVPDLNGFVAGIRTLLKPRGVAVIEVPYVRDMVERTEFDTIYHEHLCYFSVHAAAALVRRHGFVLQRVERVPIHGGSLRLFIGQGVDHDPTACALLEEESALGVDSETYYKDFGRAVEQVRSDLTSTLQQLRDNGATIAAYGAAAKGTMLLNYCRLGRETIEFVADRSPYKQGRRMPGSGIPVLPPQAIAERHPDYLLLLVWNLKDEILKQEEAYRQQGGRFIVAIPRIDVL